jgi:cell division protein FtsB
MDETILNFNELHLHDSSNRRVATQERMQPTPPSRLYHSSEDISQMHMEYQSKITALAAENARLHEAMALRESEMGRAVIEIESREKRAVESLRESRDYIARLEADVEHLKATNYVLQAHITKFNTPPKLFLN